MDNEINIYVDESGNSGQFKINKENEINDIKEQPFFVNACVVVNPNNEVPAINMYKDVKNASTENSQESELKNIFAKANNQMLEKLKIMCMNKDYVLLNINVYNKEFYITTLLISHLFCKYPIEWDNILDYYIICNNVFTQKNLLEKYIDFLQNKSNETLLQLIDLILQNKYLKTTFQDLILKHRCITIKDNIAVQNEILEFHNEFKKNTKDYQTLLPLHGISEILREYSTYNVNLYHDKTCEYEMILKQEIENNMPYIKSVEFVDSKKYELIQVSDNVSHIFNKGMKDLFSKKYSQNTFDKSTFDSFATRTMFDFIKIIGIENIKFTISICDTAYLHSCFEIYNNQKLEKYYSKIFEEKVNMIINALYNTENIVGGK